MNKCVSRLEDLSREERNEVLRPILRSGRVHNHWSSPNGTRFTLSTQGNFVVTVNSLPQAAIASIAQSSGYGPDLISTAIEQGMIVFNARLCARSGVYSIELVGTGTAEGKTGQLTLTPAANGFSARGQIAGAAINQRFRATEAPASR